MNRNLFTSLLLVNKKSRLISVYFRVRRENHAVKPVIAQRHILLANLLAVRHHVNPLCPGAMRKSLALDVHVLHGYLVLSSHLLVALVESHH